MSRSKQSKARQGGWQHRRMIAAGMAMCVGVIGAHRADATDITWSGGTNTTWSNAGNWAGGPPSTGDNAVFTGTFANQPNLIANTGNFGGIWMTGTLGQNVVLTGAFEYDIVGNTINGSPGLGILIDNTDSRTLTVGSTSTIKVMGNQNWRNNSANNFTVNAAVNINGKDLFLGGSGNIIINGVISSATGNLNKGGNGTTTLGGANANSFAGLTTVNLGTLILDKSANVNAIAGDLTINTGGTVRIASNTTTGMLNTTATNLTIAGGTFDVQGSGFRTSVNTINFTAGTFTDGDGTPNTQVNLTSSADNAFTLRGGLDVNVAIAMSTHGGITYDATGNFGTTSFSRGLTFVGAAGDVSKIVVGDSTGTTTELTAGSYSGFSGGGSAFIGVTKTGAGAFELTGISTISGTMTIAQGSYIVGADALGNTSVTQNGTWANGNATISGIADTSAIVVGMNVAGVGLKSTNLTVASKTANSVTLSAAADVTGSGTGAFSFGTRGALGSTIGGSVQIADATSGSTPIALLIDGAFTIGRNLNVNNLGSGAITLGQRTNNTAAFTGNIALGRSVTLKTLVTGANTLTFSGNLSGAGGLTIDGGGKLILSGSNSYAGTTHVANASTLIINGTHTGGGLYTVDAGTRLGGNGSIGANVTVNGTLAPGNSIDTLSMIGNLILNNIFEVEVLGSSIDKINITGNLTLGGSSILDIIGTLTDSSYTIMTYTGSLTGTFFNVADAASQNYSVDYSVNGQVRLVQNVVSVPAPAALSAGLAMMGLLMRRRK
ncbi:MAG: hypothetical protein GC162_13355 [Planctomycetes bacterium]|nr:hypothetical protein [Planctomycetota bacterium]